MAFNEGFWSSGIDNFWNKTERKEVTPEQVDNRRQDAEQSLRITQDHYKVQKTDQMICTDTYNNNLEDLFSWLMSAKEFSLKLDLAALQTQKPQENLKPIEIQKPKSEKLSEKEKVLEYWALANLAYAKYEKVDIAWDNSLNNLKVKEVSLDIGWIDIKKLWIDSNWSFIADDTHKLTPDEKFICDNFDKVDVVAQDMTNNDVNLTEIIDVALVRSNQDLQRIAMERLKPIVLAEVKTTTSDAGSWYSSKERLDDEEAQLIKTKQFIKTNRPRLMKTQ